MNSYLTYSKYCDCEEPDFNQKIYTICKNCGGLVN